MTRDQLREKINNIYDGIPIDDERQIEYANNEAEKLVKKECYAIEIHAPHLTDNLRPAFELVPGFSCPHNRDGKCLTCPQFVTYHGSEDGVFSFMTFNGYCAKDINKEKES